MTFSALKRIPLLAGINERVQPILQERRAARSLQAYRDEAARRGIRELSRPELESTLRNRVALRRGDRPAGAMGSMRIFLAYYMSSWEAILPIALSPFGQVIPFEWRTEGFEDRNPNWLQHRDAMNRAMLAAFQRANAERPVDAVVGYLSGNNTSPETLQEMASSGAAIFNFCWDDKLFFPGDMRGGRYMSPAGIAYAVDLNLTNAPESVIKYFVHGGLAMFWPEAAHPDVHRPHDVPFEFDVSFVGARYGWRPKFIEKLGKLGVKVECFGKGWPNGPLSDEEMVRLYSRSRINLGFGGVGHSRRLRCLKGRDFEVPMSGGLYLTQDNPELSLVYDVGKEIISYYDEADCAAKIRQLLANPAEAAAIREAGHRRSLRDHTYERRWADVFRLAGILQ